MKWSLELTVSIWQREKWAGREVKETLPRQERTFTLLIRNAQDQHEVACGLARLNGQAEEWMNSRRVSLVSDVVHILYTLEVSDDAA